MRLYLETFFAEAVEKTLNRLLSLDPESRKLLKPLAGKTIQIQLTPPGLILTFAPTEEAIFVLADRRRADAALRGSPLAFLRLLHARDPRGELFQGAVQIEGDLGVVQKLQRLLRHFEIDWEELLGKGAATSLQALFRWHRQSWRAFQEDLASYLQEETRALPHRLEFEDFARQVGRLRDGVARLEARLDLLEAVEKPPLPKSQPGRTAPFPDGDRSSRR